MSYNSTNSRQIPKLLEWFIMESLPDFSCCPTYDAIEPKQNFREIRIMNNSQYQIVYHPDYLIFLFFRREDPENLSLFKSKFGSDKKDQEKTK